jgi:hypothetical protein
VSSSHSARTSQRWLTQARLRVAVFNSTIRRNFTGTGRAHRHCTEPWSSWRTIVWVEPRNNVPPDGYLGARVSTARIVPGSAHRLPRAPRPPSLSISPLPEVVLCAEGRLGPTHHSTVCERRTRRGDPGRCDQRVPASPSSSIGTTTDGTPTVR